MILTSVTKHVKDQNWFAVALDFFIVVIGILIAFQITNWGEEQQAKKRERSIFLQIEEEFTEIKSGIVKQNSIREENTNTIRKLIAILEDTETIEDDLVIKKALEATRSTGRRPAQSAVFLQMMSSGDLTMLSNEALQNALISYDALLHRDAFVFTELMNMVAKEFSSNPFVDDNVNNMKHAGAAIDKDDSKDSPSDLIRSYDIEGLRKIENRYEFVFVLNSSILNSDKRLLALVSEILSHISGEKK